MFSFYRVTEFADHLHEHFIHPCLADNGVYKVPMVSLFKSCAVNNLLSILVLTGGFTVNREIVVGQR